MHCGLLLPEICFILLFSMVKKKRLQIKIFLYSLLLLLKSNIFCDVKNSDFAEMSQLTVVILLFDFLYFSVDQNIIQTCQK